MKYLWMLVLLASCADLPHHPAPAKLFPYGTYHHTISVLAKDKQFKFFGINQWTMKHFIVVGLGPMDITMFKYDKNKETSEQDLYINKDIIPMDDKMALRVMGLMEDMYSWDQSICKSKTCTDTYWGTPIDLELNDQNQVSKIKVKRDEVEVNIDVTGYESVM